MIHEAYLVDAFASDIGCGNPAGVVLLREDIDTLDMQKIAFEFGRSETAFVRDTADGCHIRWFSPLREVALCGHATLAASKILFEKRGPGQLKLTYREGSIEVSQLDSGEIGIWFPEDGYETSKTEGAYHEFFSLGEIAECIQGRATRKVILVVDEGIDLRSIKPQFEKMRAYEGVCRNGICLTKKAGGGAGYDFESRYFNPWFGVDEDPVTGSVHTVLSNYWGQRLKKTELVAYQNSGRPGTVGLRREAGRVQLMSEARVFMRGTIQI